MPTASSIRIDDSLWPLRVVRFVGATTPEQFDHYLEGAAACLRRGEKFISILDLTRGVPTPELRQRQAEWIQKHDALLRECQLGVAFVIISPLMRLALSAIFYFKAMPVPYVVTAQLSEAALWAISRLEAEGLVREAERLRHHFGLTTPLSVDQDPAPHA
ncbi:hypothetical protein [Archangium sp.]|jgi:hypothetical protein|uniref:hypothetical protein n=1 Tax=Archangium sp. TaxID=1872627 RepID=UPI002ED9B2AD